MKLLRLGITAPASERASAEADADDSGEQTRAAGGKLSTRLRRPWLAFFLGVLAPGLGQVYAGRPGRGAAGASIFLLLILPAATLLPVLLAWSPSITVLGYLLAVAIFFVVPVDGWMLARRHPGSALTRWNRLWIYAAWIVGFRILLGALQAGLPWIVPVLPWRQFSVPTGAMIPTLLIGERFIADMRKTAIDRLKRGDIVVFEAPGDPDKMWVKRIVAQPGEVIEIRDKTVFIDGRPLAEPYKVHETEYYQESWALVAEGRSQDAAPGANALRVRPSIGDTPGFFDLSPLQIPEGEWFVLGDNRDNSKDSRSFGAIPTSLIRGRATRIHGSRVPGAMRVRWQRLGLSLVPEEAHPEPRDPD